MALSGEIHFKAEKMENVDLRGEGTAEEQR